MIEWFKEVMDIPEARWIVWGTLLLTLIIVAVYIAKKFRDMALGGGLGSSELLPDADQLRNTGLLNEDEYKKIKTTIAEQRQEIVKNEQDEKSKPD